MLPKRQLQLQLLGRLNLQRSGHMAGTLRRIHSDPVVLTHSPKRDLVRSIVKYTNSARLGFTFSIVKPRDASVSGHEMVQRQRPSRKQRSSWPSSWLRTPDSVKSETLEVGNWTEMTLVLFRLFFPLFSMGFCNNSIFKHITRCQIPWFKPHMLCGLVVPGRWSSTSPSPRVEGLTTGKCVPWDGKLWHDMNLTWFDSGFSKRLWIILDFAFWFPLWRQWKLLRLRINGIELEVRWCFPSGPSYGRVKVQSGKLHLELVILVQVMIPMRLEQIECELAEKSCKRNVFWGTRWLIWRLFEASLHSSQELCKGLYSFGLMSLNAGRNTETLKLSCFHSEMWSFLQMHQIACMHSGHWQKRPFSNFKLKRICQLKCFECAADSHFVSCASMSHKCHPI